MAEEKKEPTPKVISNRHPEYIRMCPKWQFWEESYLAPIEDYARRHLFQNEKEGELEFIDRCKRAYRENHSKRTVDLINTYLFKEGPARTIENEQVKKFVDNADGRGKTLTQFMKTASVFASVFGRVYVVVDLMNNSNTGTYKDTLESTPYCYLVYPQNVLDIAFNQDGSVKWALVKEQYRDDDDPESCSSGYQTRYRLWKRGGWVLFDELGHSKEEGKTGIDTVPIVPIDNEDSVSEYFSPSLIADVAYLDRAIFNNYSRLDVIVGDQTFSQLIFPIEGAVVSDLLDDPQKQSEFMTLATNRVLFYSASAGSAKPEFISPDASQAEFILSLIKHQTRQLYACLGLQNEANPDTKDYKSGSSKSYDFDKLNKLLACKADNLEHAERRILNIVCQWKSIKAAEISVIVDYPDEFDVKSLAQEILVAQELVLLDVSNKFRKEVSKRVVVKALPKASPETITEIFNEIDKRDYDAELDAQGADFSSMNNGEDTFKDKQKSGKMGGRLNQSQSKADQM